MNTADIQNQSNELEELIQGDWFLTAVTMAVIITVTAIVSHLVSSLIRRIISQGRSDIIPSSSIFLNIARGIIWFIGICAILAICFDVDITAAIAALGIGGIALSLGFQDTISNLIGGLQVSLLKIIEPGDSIQIDTQKGVVSDIAWRHTTIITSAGETVIVPNAIINNKILIHLCSDNPVVVDFVVAFNGENLEEVSEAIMNACKDSLSGSYALIDTPQVSYTEITEAGIRGTVSFNIADTNEGDIARSLVIQAIAPLTRCVDTGKAANATDF